MDPNLTDAENVRLMQQELGVSESKAWFILRIEKGEIDGDTIKSDVDEIPEEGRTTEGA